jgi:hypothetical protein
VIDERAARIVLLEMACGVETLGPERLSSVASGGWDAIARAAAQHRLEPRLHARYAGETAVPAEIRAAWRAAHRYWTLNAMALRAELSACCGLLASHGLAPIALKGAFLAWHAYPDPALRPLRDLDLLMAPGELDEAFALLRASGYARGTTEAAAQASNDRAARTKHLEPLISPRGNVIELHGQLWEADGSLDHRLPQADATAIRARAFALDGTWFCAPEDLLAHLIIHAVYSHRMDCGPLLLWDIDFLARRHAIDWARFWERAAAEGWDRGAALVVALVRRYRGDKAIPRVDGESAPPPAELIDSAPDLLLQDLETRRSAGVAATALSGGRRALARRLGEGWSNASLPDRETLGPRERLSAWAGPRMRRTLRELGSTSVRRQARCLAQLSGWLSG